MALESLKITIYVYNAKQTLLLLARPYNCVDLLGKRFEDSNIDRENPQLCFAVVIYICNNICMIPKLYSNNNFINNITLDKFHSSCIYIIIIIIFV